MIKEYIKWAEILEPGLVMQAKENPQQVWIAQSSKKTPHSFDATKLLSTLKISSLMKL